ncbi:non-ribosomal peptide synthetase/type I polyketide synthase [Candidatus Methylobacter oryzae]|uniref:Amino acid adenylation domain-containing protein n=1 Tax=Candidatus Methylobacter oryzae TaxID=2497749 RepID=A0ABY3C6T4_9GAMM|nr:non-ribosomal peptide synthetase/type I polyketide synthase [Candidatus Methylobacter oryzae]TRW90815.1 amino acid adenylation domain-containing protein [Candidatus Methylobacter oryzae]
MKKILTIPKQANVNIKESSTKDIAIIGVSLKLADYEDTENFWEDLVSAKDRIRAIPEQRKKDADEILRFLGQDPEQFSYREIAYLDRVDEFDYRFFHLSPKEAEIMSPNQRLFMQTAWKALEDAGYGGTKLKGAKVGVFMGMSSAHEYGELAGQIYRDDSEQIFLSNVPSNTATRLSFVLDWRGPALMVDTACSSSLTAVHLACRALRANECKLALVGTVKTAILPVALEKVEIESSDGRTRTFDDSSDGTGGGEGVIAVLLKPLNQALKDQDSIYAVIKGSALNQDGTAAGMTVPNADAQAELIDQAWKDAGIDPRNLRFIEAHGTGTKLGDPIEIDGINKAFAKYTNDRQFCAVSSVKTNFGHLDHAAGLIGLVKAALSLQKKKIPPLAHFKKANSKIPFANSPVFPADRLIDLSDAEQPLLCGVSAFGLSGVNCHVVLEEAPAPKQTDVSPKVFHRFEKKRCWLKVPAAPYATNRDAVFIKQTPAQTPGQLIYEIGIDSGEDWLLNEHKAGGQTCLVGVAYFQLLAEIAKKQGYKSPLAVHELFWENLLVITPEEIRTSPDRLVATLKASPDGHAVSVLRKQPAGNWTQYATAEIKTAFDTAPARLDIEQIKARCEAIELPGRGFNSGNQSLVEVGRRWDCLEKIWKNDNERLTLLKLKDEFKADLNRFDFHPPLLDAALSSGLTEPGFLPMMCADAKLYRPIGGEIYSYVTAKSESEEIQKYDVVLADADGQLCAEFRGLTFKRVQHQCGLFRTVWLPKEQQHLQTPGEVCVLGNFSPLQDRQTFAIPRSEDQCMALIENLEKHRIGKIIYSPSLPDGDCASLEELESSLDLGVTGLFRLVKNLIKQNGTRALEILVIGKNTFEVTNDEPHLNPAYAALSGLAKVIPLEYDNIACKFLDLDDTATAEQVLAEFTGFDSPARPAAYRNGIRYEQDFRAIQSSGTAVAIKEQGVYLITGGLGGMGIEFAKDLAAQKSVKLALIGRTGLPPREEWAAAQDGKVAEKIKVILDIEAGGSEVLVIAADVSDPVQMEQAINETREKLGNIDGVLHCAGIAGDGYLFRKEEATFAGVLRPKIQGTWLLDRLTRQDKPDFFILCSALSAVLGAPGQGDYIAANAYQDAFAAFRNKQGLRTLAINWPAWKETGMAFDWQVSESQYALTTKEAIDLLHKLLAYEGSQGIIVPPDLVIQDVSQAPKEKEHTETKAKQQATVVLSGRDDGSYSPVEIAVAQSWAEILGYDEINVLDDYYSLGGDSIDANKISNLIAKKLGTKVSMDVIFSHPTIEKYAAFIDNKNRDSESRNAIEVVEKQPYYPASAAQRRLYILWELSKQSLGYNLPSILFIENKVDAGQLARAFDKLIARHESFRVSFAMKEGRLVQVIADHVDFTLSEIALKRSELDAYAGKFSRPFDLAKAPLLRAELATLDTGEQVLLFDVHHIVADAFSLQIIFQELNAFYKNENLPELKIQYKDFARWQNAHFETEAFKVHRDYWLKQFEQDIPVLDFPFDFQRPPVITYEGAVLSFSVDEELLNKVRHFSAKNETTPFMVFLSAFYLLFHKYSRQDDIIIAIADLGRNAPEVSETIGMFINHLAIRAFPKDEKTPAAFLAEVKELMVNAYAHQEYPFDQLVQKLNLPRDMSRDPLTGITFSYMNFEQPEQDESGLQFRPYQGQVKDSSKFDMAIFGTEFPDKIDFAIEYYSAVLSEATMEQFGARFLKTLGELVGEAAKTIADIDVLTAGEREKILVDFNRTRVPYPADQCVHEFFEAQAEKTPDAVALVFGEQSLSYSELNSLANQTALHLQSIGVGPEVLVGVCMQRSIEMIVGMLGILKAGGAYLPLDPDYPAERLAFMLEDAQILVLLTQSSLTGTLPATQARILCMDSAAESLRQLNSANIQSAVKPDNLAYVIYTSGSTGKPKGVAINHRNTAAFIAWSKTVFSLEELAGVAATTSICFDLSVFEIFVPLAVGGSSILLENALRLPELPADANVTLLNTVPSVINELVKLDLIPASVQVVNLAGEALKNDLVQRVYQSDTIKKVYNLYGPTEDTTYSTFALMKKGDTEAPLIGRPIDNTQAFILDNNCRPVPIGVAGELYLGGAGLARGYLNRPEMTDERFIANPFGEAGSRLYKTGDLARFLADGNIQYLGRLDNQVKIRGFRIEIPEIEATLGKYPAIVESAVLALESSDRKEKTLVAYIVADQNLDPAELKKFLNQWLPSHMVPSSFILLDAMPLTPNGKMDRRALEAIGGNSGAPENQAVMPQTELEERIAGLWKKVLRVDKVGIHDNFFEVGGHSLLLLQLQQELQTVLGKRPPMVDLFHYPTIHAFAAHLTGGAKAPEIAAPAPAVSSTTKDIAVIGMAGRFPGASDVDSFWANLRDGIESISFFSEEELLAEGIDPVLVRNPSYVKANGILDGIELFDAAFFGFSPREAEIMDPQQRLFMECAAAAIEHAGYDAERINRPVGVFAGAGMNTYYTDNLSSNRELLQAVGDYQLMVSNQNDFITTRTSYKLNLKGPSVNIQTACSTSLVAVHMACQSLLNGECDIALAGGISVKANQKSGYLYVDGMILSPDGHCRAFDAAAQGTVGGNGVGIVMLKKLDQAIADKDCIHAVIKGSAINNDGILKAGYTAPSVEGQAEVITRAMRGIAPETITYIETHGTGTPMGDPIEIAALTQAYQAHTGKKQFCAIGSVKTNIGHLDAAAGIAGLIKTIQALKHKSLPPSLHFKKPNPEIDFAGSPFYVNSRQAEWTSGGTPRRAGVSSFGIGGTNAHLVLEEAPEVLPASHESRPQVLLLSARTESALEKATANLAEHFRQNPDINLADAAFTLNTGRKVFKHRRMLVCRTADEAVKTLSTANGLLSRKCESDGHPVVFLFSGQGSQYVNMASGLYAREPVFREQVDRCANILIPLMGLDIRDILYPANGATEQQATELEQTAVAQPALFVIEYALSQLWMAWGVQPAAMLGHSIGEYVAACLAGVFSLEQALELVALRGRLMQSLPAGAMLSVVLSEQQIQPYLNADISLAAVNASSLSVVSGPSDAIEALENRLSLQDIQSIRLHTSHAFHSAMMEPILPAFVDCLSKMTLNAPQKPYISNLSGDWVTAEQATDPNYWARHLRSAVRFTDGMETLLKAPESVFLEVGPGRVLTTLVKRHSPSTGEPETVSSLPSPKDPVDDDQTVLAALGKLWLAGVSADWFAVHERMKPRRIAMPTYPFERQRYWIDGKDAPAGNSPVPQNTREKLPDWFYLPSWKISAPLNLWLEQEQTPEPANWLLFIDDCGLGDSLAEQLEGLGQAVVTVKAGKAWRQLSDNAYVMNPETAEDYETLLNQLRATQSLPQTIVHLWSVNRLDSRGTETEITAQAQATGFYSLLFLAQVLGKQQQSPLELIAVSNNMQAVTGDEQLQPEKATLLGPVQTIPQEYANIQCRSVDVTLPIANAESEQRLIGQLLAEILSKTADRAIAYRGKQRWLPSYESIHLEQAKTKKRSLLKEKGTYLITGGLGGIGLTLAEYLGKNFSANLILIGRSAFPQQNDWAGWLESHEADDETSLKIQALQALENQGVRLWIAQADAANLQQMQDVVAKANERFGPIHGVIHAAGLAGGGVIQRKTPETAASVLAPKVDGSVVLHTLFKDAKLDFLLLCSSLSAIFEAFGQVDYCAANAFLDAYALYLRSQGIPAISLNWDLWREVGMAVKTATPDSLRERREQEMQLGITPEEGREVFRLVMESALTRLMVSTQKLEPRLERPATAALPEPEPKTADSAMRMHSRPELSVPLVVPRSNIELALVNIWQKLLGIEPIGTQDDFFELGGDSLLAIGLISKLKEKLNKELSTASLYQASTVEKQAILLMEQDDSSPWSPLVDIQPEGSKPPLFCVHPAGGHAICYYDLSRCLDKDQPFYGLQASGLEEGQEPYATAEEMAAFYLKTIKEHFPQGPYRLAGWSFGGLIAFELAQQFRVQGDEVALLALFDTQLSDTLTGDQVAEEDSAEILVNVMSEMIPDLSLQELRELDGEEEQLHYVMDKALEVGFFPPGTDFMVFRRLWEVLITNRRIIQTYIPKRYDGKISFFQATELGKGLHVKTSEAWKQFVAQELDLHIIPGNHYNMVSSPQVEVLADKLALCMERINVSGLS